MEEAVELAKELDEYLNSSDFQKAQSLVNDKCFEKCVSENCWDLITVVSAQLNGEVLSKNVKLFAYCVDLINIISEKCPPEEGLLLIIDQIESLNDVRFTALLVPMQKTVLRIENNLGLSVDWCCNSIHRHLNTLIVPQADLEDEEMKLLDAHPQVLRITDMYDAVLPFYEPFVDKLVSNDASLNEKNRINLKDAILSSLFRHLGRPLAWLNLEYNHGTLSRLNCVCETIISNIYKISSDLVGVLEVHNFSNINDDLRISKDELVQDPEPKDVFPIEEKYSALKLGVFWYLLFGEGLKLETIPQVYSSLLILNRSVYLSAVLLKAPVVIVQIKGLRLLNGTLKRFTDFSIPHSELDSPSYSYLIEGLYLVAIYSNHTSSRRLAVELIRVLLFKYDVVGRYMLLVKMVKLANHSGIIGYLATLYKDVLRDILSRPDNAEIEFYTTQRVTYLLDVFCNLPNEGQSDLVELSDQIISSLNLIRFIVIKDSNNITGIKEYVTQLKTGFLKHLIDGINLSRAHYKMKLESVDSEKKSQKSVKCASRSTPIMIGNTTVPNLPHEEKVFIIKSALNGFDVMESLLCRVNECINLHIDGVAN